MRGWDPAMNASTLFLVGSFKALPFCNDSVLIDHSPAYQSSSNSNQGDLSAARASCLAVPAIHLATKPGMRPSLWDLLLCSIPALDHVRLGWRIRRLKIAGPDALRRSVFVEVCKSALRQRLLVPGKLVCIPADLVPLPEFECFTPTNGDQHGRIIPNR